MSEAELIFTALAELSTRQIAETMDAVGMDENKVAGKKAAALPKRQGVNWKQRQAERLSPARASFRRLQEKNYLRVKKAGKTKL